MSEFIALVSGLVGALIGSGTTVFTIFLKEKWAYNREMRKLALEMAKSDFEGQNKIFSDKPNHVTSLPVLVSYYQDLVKEIESGKVSSDLFKRLAKQRHERSQADIF